MPLLLHGYGMESIKITGIIQKLQLQECKDKLPSDISLSEYFRGMCARVFIGSREIVIMNDLYGDLCTEEKVSNKILTCRLAKEMRVTLIYITSILEQQNFCMQSIQKRKICGRRSGGIKMDTQALNQIITQAENNSR